MRNEYLNKVGMMLMFLGFITLFGCGGTSFFIQENVYDHQNVLLPVSDAMGSPMSLTSFFYILGGLLGFYGFLVLIMSTERKPGDLQKIAMKNMVFVNAFNIMYEVIQVFIQPYPDKNMLDIGLGLLATIIFWIIVNFYFPKRKRFP